MVKHVQQEQQKIWKCLQFKLDSALKCNGIFKNANIHDLDNVFLTGLNMYKETIL